MSNSEFGKDYKELKNKNPHSKVLRGFKGGPTCPHRWVTLPS